MILNESVTLPTKIKKLLDKAIKGTYSFDENGFCNVEGDVYLVNKKLNKLPVNFGIVSGTFNCSFNQLTALEGSPREVGRLFMCNDNPLNSLVGGPEKVKIDYCCSNCTNLTSLEGAPEEVEGNFYCSYILFLPYKELFKIVDHVKGKIFYSSILTPEDKDAIRRKRDIHMNLQHDELGNLDI